MLNSNDGREGLGEETRPDLCGSRERGETSETLNLIKGSRRVVADELIIRKKLGNNSSK